MGTKSADGQSLSIELDAAAQDAIARELGSVNKFYDRLAVHVSSETNGDAEVVPSAQALSGGDQARGGGVEIIMATATLVSSLAPIVIAWIKSRGYEATLTERKNKNGSVTRTVHVRKGAGG